MRGAWPIQVAGVVAMLALLGSGCGTMQQDRAEGVSAKRVHYRMRADRPIRVKMGRVETRRAKLVPELGSAVGRYLVDQGQAALVRHDLFEVVGAGSEESSLLNQFMETDTSSSSVAEVDGELEIVVRSVKERKGATVKVGFVSKQSKKAIVDVVATLRMANGERYTSKARGESKKGAFGVVAMVQRDAMKKKGGVWDLDGSGVGVAAARAVDACVSDIASQLHRDVRRLKDGALERRLQRRAGRR